MEELEGVSFPDFTQYNRNLILYGAGINGALCAFALHELDVEFLCFCDNDPAKQGSSYLGHPIYSLADCREHFPNAAVLVEVYALDKDGIDKLHEFGYQTILFPVPLLLGMDCERAAEFLTNRLERKEEGYSFRDEIDANQVFEWIDEYMIRGVGYANQKKEMSRALNLDLTDRCTLRCKNCLALKPYFTNRTEMSWPEMERVIDRLLALKWFRRYHIMGGEPFLYASLDKVLEKLRAAPEVEHINILTNGTVVPNEAVLKQMEDPRVVIRVSYYGDLSKNYRKLEEIGAERGIEVRVHAQRWQDIGRPLNAVSSEEETKARFEKCCQQGGSYFYVLNGKASLCPFATNTYKLGLYETDDGDIVDLLAPASSDELFQQLDKLYWRKDPLTACRYCNGWFSYATRSVPVAVQYGPGEQPVLPTYQEGVK